MEAKLYTELADWWPLMSPPEEYADEAKQYADLLVEACHPASVLELGCGGGHNASHMKHRFDLTLVDLSPDMLRVSKALNPECVHHVGDMRSIRMEGQYDAVFVHDAVNHLNTPEDLHLTFQTAFTHCRPGGAALFAPDFVAETFRPGVHCGGHDRGDRSLRYLEWVYDPDPNDTTYVAELAFLLREGPAPARVVHDHLTLGLFSWEQWLSSFRAVGFEPDVRAVKVALPDRDETDVVLCRKPE
ncbi:MAG: class I SAM-dependent methyltransferase [Planctomycetota bacterium]|jgi:SAM-dependent methyltransferase